MDDNEDARISDFGISRISDASDSTSECGGTARWMAYELVAPDDEDDEDDNKYQNTTASDVWAFAMTILEVNLSAVWLINISDYLTRY